MLSIFFFYSFLITIANCNEEQFNEELKFEDKIVNPHDFNFTINPKENICSKDHGENLLAIFYIHTAPKNYKKRLAIRETWGSKIHFPNLRLVFMMGLTNNETERGIIEFENDKFADLIQADFIDSYKNLTYKALMAMKWISQYCSKAKFFVKTDDDTIVDMYFLHRILHSRVVNGFELKRTLMCNVLKKQPVSRDYYNMWYIEKSEYSADFYGPYCSGMAYIGTIDLAGLMFNSSLYLKYFWVDDYYITGALARNLNSTYVNLKNYMTFTEHKARLNLQKKDIGNFIFTLSVNTENDFYIMWSYIKEFNYFERDKRIF